MHFKPPKKRPNVEISHGHRKAPPNCISILIAVYAYTVAIFKYLERDLKICIFLFQSLFADIFGLAVLILSSMLFFADPFPSFDDCMSCDYFHAICKRFVSVWRVLLVESLRTVQLSYVSSDKEARITVLLIHIKCLFFDLLSQKWICWNPILSIFCNDRDVPFHTHFVRAFSQLR